MKIKLTQATCFIIFTFLLAGGTFAQSINLPKECKFNFGDNPEWANYGFIDNHWPTQQLAKSFIKDSSYAWYRIKIYIPSAMKTTSGKGLKLKLGKIDDVDQTFFNGNLVGETGSFPPKFTTQWEKQRVYTIPENIVNWDKENVLAVRIYNLIGGMGMWEGPYSIEPIGWIDEVNISQTITETSKNSFSTKIIFTNKSNNAFSGLIKYWIADKANGKILFSETKNIQLQPKAGAEEIVIFSKFTDKNRNAFNVGYQVNDNNSNLHLKKEKLFIATDYLQISTTGVVQPLVQNKIQNKFNNIAFANEKYNGYLGKRLTQNLEQRLLKVDEFGLIGSYLDRPGIHPWAGEHVGKYLEAACNTWKHTHNAALKKQMDRLMYQLINTQKEDGYLGTYTPDQYWTSWDVWSHKYNLHGLLAYYSVTGYKPALESCKKMGDLLCRTFGKKRGQLDIILAGTHIGMAATSVLDAMIELYKYTADKKYLDFCYYILAAWEQNNGPKVISSIMATGKVKNVGNGKAYEMLSNYVGLIKLYQVTGEKRFLQAVETAWKDVVANQLYVTGTTSSHEYFQHDDYLPAAAKDNMGEGCVTTTWIQLNQNLFAITGDIKYLNQLEKSVYNHLLAAENPLTGCVSYYTPLMDKKPFTCNITCCQSSVPRGIALVPNFTFGKINNIPTVLFYEPAVYKEKIITSEKKNIDVIFKMEGNFPETGNMVLSITCSKPVAFPLALRVPDWCTNYIAKVGDKVYKGTRNQFVTINKNWKNGDKVIINFDMPVEFIAGGKSYPGQVAIKRGPQILAVDGSLNNAKMIDLISDSKADISLYNPMLADESKILPASWFGKQAYSLNILNTNEKIVLVPFAEASQSYADMKVWLPLQIKK